MRHTIARFFTVIICAILFVASSATAQTASRTPDMVSVLVIIPTEGTSSPNEITISRQRADGGYVATLPTAAATPRNFRLALGMVKRLLDRDGAATRDDSVFTVHQPPISASGVQGSSVFLSKLLQSPPRAVHGFPSARAARLYFPDNGNRASARSQTSSTISSS